MLLKSSWGIVIFLDMEEVREPVVQENDILVANKIYLRVDRLERLQQETAERMFSEGVRSLADLIFGQLAGKTVCFHVRAIDFNYTDFQIEGLYCAIREWISTYYNFNIKPVRVEYDVKQNRYIFFLNDRPGFI
jgi:hypothetical protein